jgi:hypothetical protein
MGASGDGVTDLVLADEERGERKQLEVLRLQPDLAVGRRERVERGAPLPPFERTTSGDERLVH